MKNFYRNSISVVLFLFFAGSFLKAQVPDDCLCTNQASYNENLIAIDTCGLERLMSDRLCEGSWEMGDWNTVGNERRAYSKIGWYILFSADVIILPAAPHDSVIEVGWEKIDSSFITLRELFRHIEEKYGKFILRKDDPEFSTGELSWSYSLFFEKYVNTIDFREETRDLEEVRFYFTMPAWPSGILSQEVAGRSIGIYPNPTSDNITITFPQNNSFKFTKLILRDITGREIFLKEFSNEKSDYTFSLKDIPVGVYILELRSGNEFFTKQISVIR